MSTGNERRWKHARKTNSKTLDNRRKDPTQSGDTNELSQKAKDDKWVDSIYVANLKRNYT